MAERYMMVEAVADEDGCPLVLVTDPEGAAARRFAGCWRDPALDGEPEFRRKFACRREVRKSHHDLLTAVKAGDLKQHGPVVVAKNHDDALEKIEAVLAAEKA